MAGVVVRAWRWMFASDDTAPAVDSTRPQPGEKTGEQVPALASGNAFYNAGGPAAGSGPRRLPSGTFVKWRKMRQHPTIALARATFSAPVRTAKMAIDADDDVPEEVTEWLTEEVKRIWPALVNNSVYALDYGFQSFETVYGIRDGARLGIDKLKMLLPEYTEVRVSKANGAFAGLENGASTSTLGQAMTDRSKAVRLDPMYCLWLAHEQEADMYYGESVLHRCEGDYERWNNTAKKNADYLGAVSSPIPRVTYPMGTSKGANGSEVDNYQIAIGIVASLKRAEGVAVPGLNKAWIDAALNAGLDPGKIQAWNIDFIDPGTGHGAEYLGDLKASEVSMARAWYVPERAIFEGQFGTKAESETQGDIALTISGIFMADVLRQFNVQVTDTLVALNFGEQYRGKLRVTVERPDPAMAQLLRGIVLAQLGAPLNADLFSQLLDLPVVFDQLGIPIKADVVATVEDKAADKAENPPEEQAPAFGTGQEPGVPPKAPQKQPEPKPAKAKDADELALPATPAAGSLLLAATAGQAFEKIITWTRADGKPVDLAGCRAELIVRAADTGQTLLTASSDNGAIELGGADGTLRVKLSAEHLRHAGPGSHAYALNVWSGDLMTPLLTGRLTVLQPNVEA